MRRSVIVMLILAFILMVATGVGAESGVTSMKYTAVVSSDGSCEVTVLTTLDLQNQVDELLFPIPEDARDVSVNGDRVRTQKSGNIRTVDLSSTVRGLQGQFTFRVDYELDDVIEEQEKNRPVLVLPMLSGLDYSISTLEMSVTLPGNVPGKPAFSSGYHQTSIEQNLEYTIDGAVITAKSLKSLKDQETLTMTLNVDAAMFPDAPIEIADAAFDDVMMIICGVLALLYWIVFLRCGPLRRKDATRPPEGFGAGEAGTLLTFRGMDLNLQIFSWAKLGYVLIQLDRNSRVLLHKRMEMGNERSVFEQKLFKSLFGRGQTVDTSSYRYAILCKKARRISPEARSLISKKSGNPMLMRYLAVGVALFAGIATGISIGAGAIAQWFWVVVFGAGGLVSGWYIQKWSEGLLLQDKSPLWLGIMLCAAWILIGLLAGQVIVGLVLSLSQLLAGLMISFGGRRTQQGRLIQGQVVGLRRYLKTLSPQQKQQICRQEPDYFHNMAPYALALGVDRAFAKRFGKEKIDPCPYLTTGMDGHRTAGEWSELFRRALETMSARERRLPMEKLIRIIESIRKP